MDMMLEFKEISILFWNIRGASSAKAKRHIIDVIRKYKPTFLVIMETHVKFDRTKVFWERVKYNQVAITEARGYTGGLWVLMQVGQSYTTIVLDIGSYSCIFSIERGGKKWVCTDVYGSPIPAQRSIFWQYLCHVYTSITSPWMLIGDFNEILLPGDQMGGIFSQARAEAFENVLNHCGLMNLHIVGGRFTWHKNCRGNRVVAKKLDRGFANLQWRLDFSEAF